MNGNLERVSIQPGVSLLKVLPHLNYKPWFAFAEFIDNAIQSYATTRAQLRNVEGSGFVLAIDIDIDAARDEIVIRDNAAGISAAAAERAFRPAAAPKDTDGLSEFGMGMKSASAWLASRWTIRSSALGEKVVRSIAFDIEAIVDSGAEELSVETEAAERDSHFTEIQLRGIRNPPGARTITQIREHLASIYRRFLQRGDVAITLNGEPLSFEHPEILTAPYWRTPEADPVMWRVDFKLQLKGGRKVAGWAALRAKGSTTRAGFALLRRERVIEGSADQTYRPRELFGASNSFTYQRLFGELELFGFDVSHTKDGVRWGEAEEELAAKLKALLSKEEMPLLDQAQNWRAGEREAVAASPQGLMRDLGAELPYPPKRHGRIRSVPTSSAATGHSRTVLDLGGQSWEVDLSLDYQGSADDWLEIHSANSGIEGTRRLMVTMSMRHPFSEAFVKDSGSINEGVARLATGLAIAEAIAADDGVRYSGRIRSSLNELLLMGLADR